MKKEGLLIGSFISIILSISLAWAGPQMNPGKWEITTKTEMAGMPTQSMTHTQCITNEDLVPMSEDANQECQVTDIKIKGNTVSWKIKCSGQGGQMDGTGQVTYLGDTMNGTMIMNIKSYGTQVKNTLSGRRIGKCDAKQSGTSGKTSSITPSTESAAGGALADDAKDIGQAARDEAKQSTIDEVREGVRGIFKSLFE